jgi:FkbM family methyltransferase
VSGSNTKRLEELGWKGVCVEPLPAVFELLKQNRTCKLENCAVWDKAGTAEFLVVTGYAEMLSGIVESYDPRHAQRIDRELQQFGGTKTTITVNTKKFSDIVESFTIDFLSIDTEGSELEILKTVDFEKYDIRVVCIENNFSDPVFEQFFANRGYRLDSTYSGCDQIYVKIVL